MGPGPKLSVILPVHGVGFEAPLAAARAAEAAGLAGIWVPDHLLNQGSPASGVLECWTTLTAVAAATRRISLGPLVLTTPLRHPVHLAKAAATLDAIAPGRLRMGLGAGGFTYAETCRQFGLPLLSPGERVEHVAETLRCLRTLWRDDPADFEGRFVSARGVRIHPRPTCLPDLLVAARGPRMLALAAREADGWNCPLPWELAAGLEAIERAGRDPASFEVSVFAIAVLGASEAEARRNLARAGKSAQLFGDVETRHVYGTPARAAARLRELADAGARHVTLDLRGAPVHEMIALIASEILPALGS